MSERTVIDTRTHPLVARFRGVRDGKDEACLMVEGWRLAEELATSDLTIQEAVATSSGAADPRVAGLLNRLKERRVPVHCVTPGVMEFLSDLDTPPGLALLAQRPAALPLKDIAALGRPSPLFVLLDGLQSPSNAGAVVRVAEAAGVHAVGALAGTADLLSPKALRASSGSAFRVPLFCVDDLPAFLASFDAPPALLAADAQATKGYTAWDWTTPSVLLLGAEGKGLSSPARWDLPVEKLRVPMSGAVESLNVAVAAGIILMEARRQRNADS